MSKKLSGLRFQSGQQSSINKTVPVGKKQRLTIERWAHDGRGIALLGDKTWFVAGGIPSEEVEVRVISSQNKYINTVCEKVLTASPLRQSPPCQYAGICGGCELQHIAYNQQVSLKQATVIDQFQRFAGIGIEQWQPPLISEPFGYRRRTRIAVRYNLKTKQLDIGFRAALSQTIIPVTDCLILVEPLRLLLQQIPTCLNQLQGAKHIGHIELFAGSTTAMLVRHTAPLSEADQTQLLNFCQSQHCQLWLQGKEQAKPYPVEQSLSYTLTIQQQTINIGYHLGQFIQVNTLLNQAMVTQALDWLTIKNTDRILDLFCGLGNFSLPLATKAKQVIGIEVVDTMVKLAEKNAQLNHLTNIAFYQANLNQPFTGKTWANNYFSTILLDPPREGAKEVISQMKELDTKQILYISCNPATLARDASLLIDQGYKIKKAGIIDMFPQTSHIEVMLLFEQ